MERTETESKQSPLLFHLTSSASLSSFPHQHMSEADRNHLIANPFWLPVDDRIFSVLENDRKRREQVWSFGLVHHVLVSTLINPISFASVVLGFEPVQFGIEEETQTLEEQTLTIEKGSCQRQAACLVLVLHLFSLSFLRPPLGLIVVHHNPGQKPQQ